MAKNNRYVEVHYATFNIQHNNKTSGNDDRFRKTGKNNPIRPETESHKRANNLFRTEIDILPLAPPHGGARHGRDMAEAWQE
jgi:hypothetical protein